MYHSRHRNFATANARTAHARKILGRPCILTETFAQLIHVGEHVVRRNRDRTMRVAHCCRLLLVLGSSIPLATTAKVCCADGNRVTVTASQSVYFRNIGEGPETRQVTIGLPNHEGKWLRNITAHYARDDYGVWWFKSSYAEVVPPDCHARLREEERRLGVCERGALTLIFPDGITVGMECEEPMDIGTILGLIFAVVIAAAALIIGCYGTWRLIRCLKDRRSGVVRSNEANVGPVSISVIDVEGNGWKTKNYSTPALHERDDPPPSYGEVLRISAHPPSYASVRRSSA